MLIYRMRRCWTHWKEKQTRGSATVEIILVLVVLIALVAIFKTQLTGLVRRIFARIVSEATGI